MLDLQIDEGDELDAARAAIARAHAAGKSRATIDRLAARLRVAWGVSWTGAVQVIAAGDDGDTLW